MIDLYVCVRSLNKWSCLYFFFYISVKVSSWCLDFLQQVRSRLSFHCLYLLGATALCQIAWRNNSNKAFMQNTHWRTTLLRWVTARGNGNTLSNLWYMQMSLQLRLLHTSVKGGREETFFFFFQGGREGGRRYMKSELCQKLLYFDPLTEAKSWLSADEWRRRRHTHRERERR